MTPVQGPLGCSTVRRVLSHAVGRLLYVVVDVLVIMLLVIASAVGLAAIAGLVFLATKLRDRHTRRLTLLSPRQLRGLTRQA